MLGGLKGTMYDSCFQVWLHATCIHGWQSMHMMGPHGITPYLLSSLKAHIPLIAQLAAASLQVSY